jgi:hypothetical protein
MADDSGNLHIGVTVDVSELAKLAEASKSVAENTSSMAEMFNAATEAATEFAASLASVSEAMTALHGGQLTAGVQVEAGAAAPAASASTAANQAAAASAQELSASLSEAGQASAALASEIIESSTATRAAGLAYAAAARDVQLLKAEVRDAQRAMVESAGSEEESAAASQRFLEAKTSLALATQRLTEAETTYKAALAESYADYQAGTVGAASFAQAVEQVAAARAREAEAAQMAMAAEAAAGEGMVGAEVSVAAAAQAEAEALAAKTSASSMAAQAAQQHAAAMSQSATAAQSNLSTLAQLTASLMADSMSAEQATAALRNLGYSLTEIRGAMAELGIATASTSAETTRLAATSEVAATKIDAMTRALALSSVRMAASEVGAGQFGFALSRLGALSSITAPLLAATFPAIAILVFTDLMGRAISTMEEWQDLARKSAEENAKWERSILKSAEAVEKMNEKLAGQASPLAASAIESANLNHQVLDLSQNMSELNKRLEDGPSLWKDFKEAVGTGLTAAFHLFDDAAQDAQRNLVDFNVRLAANVKTFADLPGAIDQVREKIRALREEQANINLAAFDPDTEANFDRQVALLSGELTRLESMEKAHSLEMLSIQQGMNERLAAEQERATLAQVSFEEAQVKAITMLHSQSAAEELATMLRLNRDRTNAELANIAERRRLLEAQAKAQPEVDFSSARKSLDTEATRIRTAASQREFEIVSSINRRIAEDAYSTAVAVINANEMIARSYLTFLEARDRTKFEGAETVPDAQEATKRLLQDNIDLYERETKAVKEDAGAKLDALDKERALAGAAPVARPTAEFGTMDYQNQLAAIQTFAPQIYSALVELNARAIDIRQQGQIRAAEITEQGERKVESITLEAIHRETEEQRRAVEDQVEQLRIAKEKAAEPHVGMFAAAVDTSTARAQMAQVAQQMSDIRNEMAKSSIDAAMAQDLKVVAAYNSQLQEQQIILDHLGELYEKLSKEGHDTFAQLGRAMEGSIDSGFRSFNSGIARMVVSGQSFGQVMRSVAGSMASTFIEAVLEMGEKWVITHVLMAAVDKIFGVQKVTTEATTTAASIAASKARAMALAGEAGAGGVASMAAAPFPIDLTAPAFGASMMAAAASMAMFEEGGLVGGRRGEAVPAVVHGSEAVLNERATRLFMSATDPSRSSSTSSTVNNNTSSGGENHTHVHYHGTINASALDSRGMEDVLEEHGDKIFDAMVQRLRRRGMVQ